MFFIFSESLLVLSQSDIFFISIFKSFSIFLQIFPLDKHFSIICIHNGKGDMRNSIIYIYKE